MANAKAALKQSDLTRYTKAVQKAGLPVSRIEIDPVTGKVVIFTTENAAEGANPCDRLLD